MSNDHAQETTIARYPRNLIRSVDAFAVVSLLILAAMFMTDALATESERELNLAVQAEAEALKGYIVHRPGEVLAVEGDHAYSPYAPNEPRGIPTSGEVTHISDCGSEPYQMGSQDGLLSADETAVIVVKGAFSRIPRATVVATQRRVAGARGLDNQLAPTFIRIFDSGHEIGSFEVGTGAFPCAVILDDFDGLSGNEIGFVWASVAAGYTIGVTILTAND